MESAIVSNHFSSRKRLLIRMHLLWILCFLSVSMSKLRNSIEGVRGRGCWSKYFYFILKYFYCIKTRKPFKYLQSASLLTAATCLHFHYLLIQKLKYKLLKSILTKWYKQNAINHQSMSFFRSLLAIRMRELLKKVRVK